MTWGDSLCLHEGVTEFGEDFYAYFPVECKKVGAADTSSLMFINEVLDLNFDKHVVIDKNIGESKESLSAMGFELSDDILRVYDECCEGLLILRDEVDESNILTIPGISKESYDMVTDFLGIEIPEYRKEQNLSYRITGVNY